MLLPVDDSFKMDATSLSNLLSAVSSGMEKARMGQAESGGTWGTQTNPKFNSSLIVTTNFDISSVIGSGRSFDAQMDTDAARSRLLEVPSHFIKKPGAVLPAQWRDHEAAILANHGWALDVFARHVVPRQRVIADELHATENEVFTSLKAQVAIADMGLLRFWAKYLACVYIAGRVLTLDAAILPWDANAILRAGKELVVMADEEAKVEKESLVEALWSVLQDDVRERYAINRSWMITTPEGLWPHWDDTSADLTRGRLRRWDDTVAGQQLVKGTPVPGFSRATLNTPYDWRVTMTKVVATNGDTVRYEREVVITLQTLDNIVASNAGRTIKCGDWSEVYNAFETEGTVIGVKRGSPKRYGNKGTERCRIPIDAVPGVKGRGLRCVKLTWPPLDPSEVEPA